MPVFLFSSGKHRAKHINAQHLLAQKVWFEEGRRKRREKDVQEYEKMTVNCVRVWLGRSQ